MKNPFRYRYRIIQNLSGDHYMAQVWRWWNPWWTDNLDVFQWRETLERAARDCAKHACNRVVLVLDSEDIQRYAQAVSKIENS